MYKEYPISKELEEASWKDNLFIDFIPVSSDPDHSVVLCVVCAKDGKRVVRGGEVFGGGQDSSFLQAMENAKAAALSVFYGKALPDLNNGKKAPSEQAAASPGENQSNSNSPSRETADQNRTRAVSGSNMANQAEPMKNAPATSTAGQAEGSAAGRQNSTPVNRQNAAPANRQQPASSNRSAAGPANRQNASANRQQPASQSRQAAAPINRQPEAPQQPSSPQQSASAAMAGAESAAAGMSGDDDFRVYIGPYAKKENNYISWIVANDLDFIRRICNLTNPLPTYADTIEKIKTYVAKHGIAL